MEKGFTIQILDKGYVKYIDHMGADQVAIEAARMSTSGAFNGWDKDEKLLKYLYEHQHMTPFECAGELHIEAQLPIFVVRQVQRHRSCSFNEFSGRYAEMPDLYYMPDKKDVKAQSQKNKQASGGEYTGVSSFQGDLASSQIKAQEVYKKHLDNGLARETARFSLPVSHFTRMRMKTDLRNWLGFLKLRMQPDVQFETREFANAVAQMVKELWPRTYALFEEFDLHGKRLGKSKLDKIKDALKDKPELLKELGL